MSGGACFGCTPGYEGLAAELAGLVNGSWVLTPGVHDVMIMANGATVPRELPGQASQEARVWWHNSVSTTLAPLDAAREWSGCLAPVTEWSFLTNHARVLLCVAHDPGIRLRDIATTLGVTERTAHGIVADLANAGYLVKERDGRRNRYQIQHHLPLPEATANQRTIGDVLDLLGETDTTNGRHPRGERSKLEPARRPDDHRI